jgi:hypothetical protein
MDWPGRTLWSAIAFRWRHLKTRPHRRLGGARRLPPPTQRDDAAADRQGLTETLHSLGREGDHAPLYVLTVTDRDGHLLAATACDADDYRD